MRFGCLFSVAFFLSTLSFSSFSVAPEFLLHCSTHAFIFLSFSSFNLSSPITPSGYENAPNTTIWHARPCNWSCLASVPKLLPSLLLLSFQLPHLLSSFLLSLLLSLPALFILCFLFLLLLLRYAVATQLHSCNGTQTLAIEDEITDNPLKGSKAVHCCCSFFLLTSSKECSQTVLSFFSYLCYVGCWQGWVRPVRVQKKATSFSIWPLPKDLYCKPLLSTSCPLMRLLYATSLVCTTSASSSWKV